MYGGKKCGYLVGKVFVLMSEYINCFKVVWF